jgi:hypothetical protein
MVDLSHVQGPTGSPENLGRKERPAGAADPNKFKETMRRKIREPSAVDPDEQKKRKRGGGIEEEEWEELPEVELSAPSETTPAFSIEEMEDDAGMLEESSFNKHAPPAVPGGEDLVIAPSESKREHAPREVSAEEAAEQIVPPSSSYDAHKLTRAEKKVEVLHALPVSIQHSPLSADEEEETQRVQPIKTEENPSAYLQTGTDESPTEQLGEVAMPEKLAPYANLHPEVMELFDRMAGVITVMNTSGLTETTITLNNPLLASSVFFGTQIVIREYSSAPKAFNIQVNGSPQAVALLAKNTKDVMATFEKGDYNFTVNRLETGYISARDVQDELE